MEQQNNFDPSLRCLTRDGSDESTGEKLWREAELLLSGGGQGFVRAATESVDSDHLAMTAGKVVLGVGIGVGLACLSRRGSVGINAVRAFGAVSSLAFAHDGALHGPQVLGAMQDNWQSSANWNRNVNIMERTVGQFAFDTVLMGASGAAGSAIQPRLGAWLPRRQMTQTAPAPVEHIGPTVNPEYPLGFPPSESVMEALPVLRVGSTGLPIEMFGADSATGQLASRYGKSIVRVRSETPAHGDLFWKTDGSGFFVRKDGTLATAFHVVDRAGAPSQHCFVEIGGKRYPARVESFNAADDLALLKVEGIAPELIEPLPIARGNNPLSAQTETLCFGYGSTNTLHVSPGAVKDVAFRFEGSNAISAADPAARYIEIAARTKDGVSGGPVFNATTGEVIGVHAMGTLKTRSFACPAETLLALMAKAAAQKQS